MQIKTTTRKWGNSIAVVIPKELVEKQKIKEDEEITINVEKQRPRAGALWGVLRSWKRSAQEIKDDARAGWLSKSDRKKEKKWKNQK